MDNVLTKQGDSIFTQLSAFNWKQQDMWSNVHANLNLKKCRYYALQTERWICRSFVISQWSCKDKTGIMLVPGKKIKWSAAFYKTNSSKYSEYYMHKKHQLNMEHFTRVSCKGEICPLEEGSNLGVAEILSSASRYFTKHGLALLF